MNNANGSRQKANLTPSDQPPPMSIIERKMWAASHQLPRNMLLLATSEMAEINATIISISQGARQNAQILANVARHYFLIDELRESGQFEELAKQIAGFKQAMETIRKTFPLAPLAPVEPPQEGSS